VKVYLDTNVLVSAFATRGLCADVLRHIIAEHELLTGEVNLEELRQVLKDRFEVPHETVVAIEEFIREQQVIACPKEILEISVRDPDDAWVLASAAAGSADALVTGDKDLLDISDNSPVRILDPRAFWDMITQKSKSDQE